MKKQKVKKIKVPKQKNKSFVFFVICFILLLMECGILYAASIEYQDGKRRNPFIPLSVDQNSLMGESVAGFRLEGIIYDPRKESMAILNGKPYKKGDAVGDARVQKIDKNSVVLLTNGEEKILKIREEEKNWSP